MNNQNYQPIIYSLILIFGLYLGSIFITPNPISENDKINSIITLIEENYVDGFDVHDFEDVILASIMKELDPHSNYIPKKEQAFMEDDMKGSFSGVGIEFNIIQDTLVVVSPISGGPSEKLGILSGDRIVIVDGENIASVGLINSDVVEKLRGEKGSEVIIKIYRRGVPQLLEYTIERGDIPMYSVDASFMLKKEIGYIKVNRFSATTNQEFFKGTKKLLSLGMKKLVLDLRGNPGGYLGSAIYMCNEFLREGELIVFTEGKYRKREDIYSDDDGSLQDIELVILINEGSASASEIVSGCMQDLDRGVIVGVRSFGKGLVQEEIRLKDGSAVRLTTQRYYIPSGRSIQKPYGANDKEYLLEQYTRDENESYPDSLKFKTKNGRIVYGRGGVTPDSVIIRDTNMIFIKINYVYPWIDEFCLTEKNIVINKLGKHYKKYDFDNLGIDLFETAFLKDFVKFVNEKDKNFDFTLNTLQEEYLKNLLKAKVARIIWGEEVYRKILSQDDDYIIKSLEILD